MMTGEGKCVYNVKYLLSKSPAYMYVQIARVPLLPWARTLIDTLLPLQLHPVEARDFIDFMSSLKSRDYKMEMRNNS